MAEYSRLAKGHFTSTGLAQVVNLPFQPDAIEMWNYSSFATPANHGVPYAYWDVMMGQGFAIEQVFDVTPVLSTDIVTSNGFSTFSGGLSLQLGATIAITSISKANPALVTTTSSHGLASGDVVIFSGLYETATTGMPQISGIPFTVTVTGATTFTIPWNTNQSGYTAISGAATGTPVCKKLLYPYIYFPGVSIISNVTLGTTTTIDTTSAHNLVVGQQVAFHIPSVWGTTQLNELPNVVIPGQPVTGYVTSVTDYNTVVVDINSTGYTAFNSNRTVSETVGLNFAQMVAVGDVNTGATPYSGGALYPSPTFRPIGNTTFSTIGGPAILGSFVNNSSQGFIIGAGAGATDTSSVLVGAVGNVIYWRALLHDYSS